MDITLAEIFKGLIAGGLLLGLAVLLLAYTYCMLRMAFKFGSASQSSIFTKKFGEGANRERHKLRDHLMEHGMTLKQAADCMNSWE